MQPELLIFDTSPADSISIAFCTVALIGNVQPAAIVIPFSIARMPADSVGVPARLYYLDHIER
jgi:hypothetical protein